MIHVLGRIAWMGVGAVAMYYADPVSGRRRRALLVDQINRGLNDAADILGSTGHDLRNRGYGFVAEARARHAHEEVSDDVLVERARAAMGHVVAKASAIELSAREGELTVRGEVPADEVDSLLSTLSSIPGVKGVQNELRVERADG